MTSQINPADIDGNYPIAGVSNNTQGMRDNFTNTRTNFQYASDEITDLQNKAVLKVALSGTTLDNNLGNNLVYNALVKGISGTVVAIANTSGTITIDCSAGPYQSINMAGNIGLSFISSTWPTAGTLGMVRTQITVDQAGRTLTLPNTVSNGIVGIQGYASNVITFANTGTYEFGFSTTNAGNAITIFDLNRPLNYYTNGLNISGDITIGGNIIPTGNNVYSLGSPTHQWADLYVSNSSIILNGVVLSVDAANTLSVNGDNLVTDTALGLDGSDGILSGYASISIGTQAGNISQSTGAIAIGSGSGNNQQGSNSISIGVAAGGGQQGANAISIGLLAGTSQQGANSVAIGLRAGSSTQGSSSVSIGDNAGKDFQGNRAVAIGYFAGNASQGSNSIAIGSFAGTRAAYSGNIINQANNTIVINATGANLSGTIANTFSIAPVRNDVSNVENIMFYNTTTFEVTYGNTVNIVGNAAILSGTAVPAGGTAGAGYKFSSTANLGVFFGSGAPSLAAAKGSLYLRTDGSATNNRMYVNTDGSTTWTAVITAA